MLTQVTVTLIGNSEQSLKRFRFTGQGRVEFKELIRGGWQCGGIRGKWTVSGPRG